MKKKLEKTLPGWIPQEMLLSDETEKARVDKQVCPNEGRNCIEQAGSTKNEQHRE